MRKWFGILKNGFNVSEANSNWTNIKDKIKSLNISNNGQIISLPENLNYIQGKSASATFNGNVQIESRYIGFVLGNNIVKIIINEINNNINIEVIKLDDIPHKTNPE